MSNQNNLHEEIAFIKIYFIHKIKKDLQKTLILQSRKTSSSTPKCWICNSIADSKEHKFKKSDLVRAYGKNFNANQNNRPVHVTDGKTYERQGPNAEGFKYEKSLCSNCNNAKSQPFDRAYDTFINWFFEHQEQVLLDRMINFEDVFGSQFEEGQINFFKYLVKSFGCRLVDAGYKVPFDLTYLFNKNSFKTRLKISFSINKLLFLLDKSSRDSNIYLGDLIAYKDAKGIQDNEKLSWDMTISWLRIHFWYGVDPYPNFGSPWIANTQVIYLGHGKLDNENKEASWKTTILPELAILKQAQDKSIFKELKCKKHIVSLLKKGRDEIDELLESIAQQTKA